MTSKGLLASLTEDEYRLVTETEASSLADLDEDELVELHTRVRRARTKYVTQYRRGAAARVGPSGGRGAARPGNRRAADKAEVFEDPLSSGQREQAWTGPPALRRRVAATQATGARRQAKRDSR